MAATLSQLRTQIRDLADEPLTGGTVADDRYKDYINLSLGELHELVVHAYEDHFIKQQTVSVVSGTESYALPSDYHKTRGMFVKDGDDRFKLDRFHLSELDRFRPDLVTVAPNNQHLKYAIFDNDIWFAPKPTAATTVEHWYVYTFTALSNDSDEVSSNLLQSWEDFVICSGAHRVAVRNEMENVNELLQLKEAARTRITAACEERDAGEPNRVVDVTGRLDWQEEWDC